MTYNELNIQDKNKVIYPKLSYEIVGCLFDVYNTLGGGYREKHYQKALEINFTLKGINFKAQAPFFIRFQGKVIGKYYMDFIMDDKVVLEIKRGDYFSRTNIEQIKNYLIVTNMQLGILANFTNNKMRYMRILNIK